MTASRTDETVRPAARRQILLTGLLGGELTAELVQRFRVGRANPTDCGRLKQPDKQDTTRLLPFESSDEGRKKSIALNFLMRRKETHRGRPQRA